MISYDELAGLNAKELADEAAKAQLDLLKARLGVSTRQEKHTAQLKGLRKYIARIKTIKRAMEFEKAPENAKSAVTK